MHFELYRDIQNFWRWTLYAANHRKIANSGEGYYNRSDALSAIKLVQSSISAPIR